MVYSIFFTIGFITWPPFCGPPWNLTHIQVHFLQNFYWYKMLYIYTLLLLQNNKLKILATITKPCMHITTMHQTIRIQYYICAQMYVAKDHNNIMSKLQYSHMVPIFEGKKTCK